MSLWSPETRVRVLTVQKILHKLTEMLKSVGPQGGRRPRPSAQDNHNQKCCVGPEATVGETEGLMNHHADWFHALINIFICHGYSACWKVVR